MPLNVSLTLNHYGWAIVKSSVNSVFFLGGGGHIRTLVAMAIYSSHRLIIEKVEINSFCCLIGDIRKKISYVNCVVLPVSYDFCPNRLI